MVEDVVVKTAHAVRKLQTCGKVVVQRRGRVIADLVVGQEGIEVIGVLEAKVARGGPVKITSKALWRGDCHASAISVEEGAKVTSGQFVVPYAAYELPEATGAGALSLDFERVALSQNSCSSRARCMIGFCLGSGGLGGRCDIYVALCNNVQRGRRRLQE
jgi:cytoskeletal protein CcmA (bactofilin family)